MTASPTPRLLSPINVIALLGVIALIVILGMSSNRPPSLNKSALGFDGLVSWSAQNGRSTRSFSGGSALGQDTVSLRVLPLYDSRVDSFDFPLGQDVSDPYLRADLRPISRRVVQAKIETLPTLIIYPKWRDGVRRTGLLHADFRVFGQTPEAFATINRIVTDYGNSSDNDLDPEDMPPPIMLPRPIAPTADVVTAVSVPVPGEWGGGHATLHAPQLVELGPGCEMLVGEGEQALLQMCTWQGHRYWILSDPDVMNNHGLARADNARIALSVLDTLTDDGEIVVDYSQRAWITGGEELGRQWSDLMRVFEPPLLWLWLAAALLALLTLWRGAIRNRPPPAIFGFAHGAARRTVLEAQAKLMRRTGRDGALLRALAENRLAELCLAVLGREGRGGDPRARLIDSLRRKDEELALRLHETLNEIFDLPDQIAPELAEQLLARLESVYLEVLELS